MKDKTPLLLIEQLIMILVFALTAALCLRGFAYAADQSKQIQWREQAAILAQSTAEDLKAAGDAQDAISFYDGDLQPVAQDDDWTYRMQVSRTVSNVPGLGQASICVEDGNAEELIVLTVGWQEAMP